MSRFQRLAGCWTLVAVIAALAALLPSLLQAQTTYGSIVGTVTDASGAAVPAATVAVTNLGTNETRSIKSDASGNFSVVNLLPANYKVEVEKTNFKRYLRQPVPVAVGATVRADIALQVGAASETVEVTTQAPLLQTDSGTMSTQVTGQTVQEMPLNGRNTMNLLALSAGVVPQGSTSGGLGQNQGQGHTMVGAWGNYQIGGALAGENATYLDGAPVNTMSPGLASNNTAMIMTQDAVQEFNVASNSVSAEFGRFAGGVINMASKSGTNSAHGSVYEYFRNAFFNANDWFNKATQLSEKASGTINPSTGKVYTNKPLQWNQNQYGLAIGGPVKKDKVFYHFTWEGFRSDTAQPTPTNVPDANMQSGIIANSAISGGTLTDPLGKCTFDTTSHPGYTVVPASCWDPLAKVIGSTKGYYPLPNQNVAVGSNNYYAAPATPDKQNQYNARVDYALSNIQHLFARYTYWTLWDAPQSELGDANGWKTAKSSSSNYSQQAVLGDTYTFSSRTILDARLSWLRDDNFSAQPQSLGQDFSVFPGTYLANSSVASALTAHMLPTFSVNNISAANYNLYGVNTSYGEIWSSNYALAASLIRIMGNHSLKVGAELRLMVAQYGPGGTSGGFSFGSSQNGGYTGNGWADFLMGYEQGGFGMRGPNSSIQVQIPGKDYNYYQGYYLTDTWQATHRLTVNAGVRWELPGGIFTKNDYNDVLLPDTNDSTYTSVKGTLALVNSPQYSSRSSVDIKHDLFAPRLGLAYRLGSDMTIRAGYGLSYLPIDSATGAFSQSGQVISATTACGTSAATPLASQLLYNCFAAPGSGTSNAITPPPLRSSIAAGKSLVAALNYLGNSISGAVPHQRVPYSQEWNLSVGRQFKGQSMLELGYAGSKGTFIPINGMGGFQLDQIPDGTYTTKGSDLGTVTSGADSGKTLLVAGPHGYSANPNGSCGQSVGQCLRPYPSYGGVSNALAYHGSVVYHALIIKGEKRFGTGGTLMGNYSWAKQTGNTDTNTSFFETATTAGGFGSSGSIQDYNNMKAEHSVLTYDVPQRAVISYILSLPFGAGQKWGTDTTGVVSRMISGWGVSGITTFQKGFHVPISLGHGNYAISNNFGGGTLRPDYKAGCSKASTYSGNGKVKAWFNTGCFTYPGGTTGATYNGLAFGNEPRADANIFSEGIDNFDFTALKTTKVTEATNVQFRAEFFNLFNRKQFSPPDSTVSDSTFGQILSSNGHLPRVVQFSLRVNF